MDKNSNVINMGAGLDSVDAKWKSHITIHMAKNIHHQHHLKDIWTGFEEHAEVSIEEFITDNELKLFSRRQTRQIHRGSDGHVWKWDQPKWW